MLHDGGVAHEFLPEHHGDGIAGAIIASRPEPAGRDDDVGPRPALAKLLGDRAGLVRDRHVAFEQDTVPAELGADKCQVSVRREPEQQLVAQREQFVADLGHRFARRRAVGVVGRKHTCET